MYLTTRALVLRVTEYNDRDALLTILTPDSGKLTVKVRGLRRKNNPLVAPCQLLAYADFTLFEYRGAYTVNEAVSRSLFQGLRKDLCKLSLATYFAQVAEVLSQEDIPNPELLSLVLNCFYALEQLEKPDVMIKSVFELRAVSMAGYTPDLFGCHNCGEQQPDFFDISHGHLSCAKCRSDSDGIRMPVNAGVLEAMRYIVYCEPKRLFSFSLSDSALQQLASATEGYLTTQLERGFSTLDFYKSLLISI